MPLIVDPNAPLIEPPERVTSPDGYLAAIVDEPWAGVVLSYNGNTPPALADVSAVRKVRIVRQDPGAAAPVPVRSADPAWAIGGVGTAYDAEAPLGAAVIYTAVPVYEDGSTGPESALAVTMPVPDRGPRDVWIKSLDEPGLSARVTVTSWPDLTWAARIDQAAVQGSAYPVTSQDVYGAPSSEIVIDAEGDQIPALEALLATPGVRLIQTRPDYYRADQYVLLGDVKQGVNSTPNLSRTYSASVVQVDRPDTAGQPLRMPGWSWDEVANRFATWDAVAASYSSWAMLSTNGVT